MKTKALYLFFITPIIIVSISLLSSCNKYLNTVPTGLLRYDSIFSSLSNTNAYLMDVYYGRPDGFYQRFAPANDAGPWTAASDEANDYSQPSIVALANAMNLSSWGTTSGNTYWTDWYKCIRTATDFINHIDGTTAVDVTDFLKVHFKAEARGLRAIFYFWLLRLYGPIPILHDEIDVNASGSSVYIPRTPFDTCISYIVSQLDSAYDEIQSVSNADHLGSTPISLGTNPEYGRITTGICKAYKEQALMLAASPLFNGNTDYAALKNNDGTQLISQTSDINKWKLAADAAKAFIDEFVPGTYSIYTSTGSDSFTNAYNSCRNVVITDWNSEWIWGRSYLSSVSTYIYDITPPLAGYNSTVAKGGGFLAVNQSMVDAFFTKNGRTITDPESGYQTAGFSDFKAPYDIKARKTYNQWINREPRFYVDVTYNNSYWINQGTSPTPVIVDYTYTGNSGRKNSSTNLAATGYNVRKQLTSSTSSRSWCYIRLAQIYLDYAEALNEYDPGNSDILTYLNKIRQRAGIPIYGNGANDVPVPSSQAAMRTAIWNERQVELAFEEVRYFDVRRWRVAAQTMGASVYGMNMFGDSTTFYQKTLDQTRRFLSRDYLWPIPNTEILVNNSMVQNPGW